MYDIGHNRYERYILDRYRICLEVMVQKDRRMSFARVSVGFIPTILAEIGSQSEIEEMSKELNDCAVGIHSRYQSQFNLGVLHRVQWNGFQIIFDRAEDAQKLYDRIEQEFMLEKLKRS
jgi:hypothetical protein